MKFTAKDKSFDTAFNRSKNYPFFNVYGEITVPYETDTRNLFSNIEALAAAAAEIILCSKNNITFYDDNEEELVSISSRVKGLRKANQGVFVTRSTHDIIEQWKFLLLKKL